MKYLIVVLSVVFLLGCGHTSSLTEEEKLEVIVDIVKQLAPEEQQGPKQSTFGNYTYEGMIDPNTIMSEWEEVTRNILTPMFGEIYYENPNHDELLRYATVVMYIQYNTMAGYSYMLDGIVYVFQFNNESKNYAPHDVGEENQKIWLKDYHTYFNISVAS